LHEFDPTARSVFGCFVDEATGDFMPLQPRTATFASARWRQSWSLGLGKFSSDMGPPRSFRRANYHAGTLSPAHFGDPLSGRFDGDLI